ncbi:winged helix-turn-helix transcriptional regulator [Actinoplanes sp. NPDC051861]|uniref:winged helix-turn-helix transcriptional regulator n=1 Tax=Actinoplanes sp. NPDC051861 TaxID=3155170 RepID=UPI00341DC259
MTKRAYGQYCGLARALELVGEKWALLILRDLFVGPRRFSDLHRGLPKISTNILASRLRELEEGGLIRRRVLPRPASGVVYELTEYGADLEDTLLSLGRWGARSLGVVGVGEVATEDSLVMALRATFRPPAQPERIGFELRFADTVVHAVVEDDQLRAGTGGLDRPDLVIITGPEIRDLMSGELSPDDAVASGRVRIDGDLKLLKRFVELFVIDPSPRP